MTRSLHVYLYTYIPELILTDNVYQRDQSYLSYLKSITQMFNDTHLSTLDEIKTAETQFREIFQRLVNPTDLRQPSCL